MEAVVAGPPRAVAVVASRAKPPERSSVTIIVKYSEFRINYLENNCHTASPPTTGKLTENKINIISHLFVGGENYVFSNEEKHSVCLLMYVI